MFRRNIFLKHRKWNPKDDFSQQHVCVCACAFRGGEAQYLGDDGDDGEGGSMGRIKALAAAAEDCRHFAHFSSEITLVMDTVIIDWGEGWLK